MGGEVIDYTIMNEVLDEFIFGGHPLFYEDYMFEMKMCEMVLRNKSFFQIENIEVLNHMYDTKKKISLDKTIEITKSFINHVNKKYSPILEMLLDKGMIVFNETSAEDAHSFFEFNEEEEVLNISRIGTIEDVFVLAHEFMHYLNNNREVATPTTSYYTEILSSYIELILCDFIIKYYPEYAKDARKMKMVGLIALYETNVQSKIFFEILKRKIEGKVINTYEMKDIVKEVRSFCDNLELIEIALDHVLDGIYDDIENFMITSARYTSAPIIASYLHQERTTKDVFDFNDKLPKMEFEDVIGYLDLSFCDEEGVFDLKSNDYTKLEKTYKKELKKIW